MLSALFVWNGEEQGCRRAQRRKMRFVGLVMSMMRGRGEATTVDCQKQEGSVLLYIRHSGPGFNHNLNFNQHYCSIVRECDMP